jgi:hypothetical protein
MRVKLKERRFTSSPDTSTGLFEVVESEGVSEELLPAPRFVGRQRITKLAQAGVCVEFESKEPKS